MDRTFEIGGAVFSLWQAAAAGGALVVAVLLLMLLVAWRRAVARAERGAVLEA